MDENDEEEDENDEEEDGKDEAEVIKGDEGDDVAKRDYHQ